MPCPEHPGLACPVTLSSVDPGQMRNSQPRPVHAALQEQAPVVRSQAPWPEQPAVMLDPSWGRKGSQEAAPAQGSSGSLGTIAGKKKSERRKSIGQEVVIATPSGPKVVRRVSDDSEDDEDDEKTAALTALDAAGLTTKLDNEGGTLVPTAAPKVTGEAGPHKAYESLGLGAGLVPTIVKKMDVDGDGGRLGIGVFNDGRLRSK